MEKLNEILKEYDPIEVFKQKHEAESEEEFNEWLNK